jgi:hypothetical protein
MINNSNTQRWDRLKSKQLDSQFLSEIIQGLNCSPFEATAILDTVHRVFKPFFEASVAMTPGQIQLPVISAEESPAKALKKARLVTVTLTLDAGEEDLDIRKEQGVIGLRHHRMIRICNEAFQQGGLLTVEDLAYRVFNCGDRTIKRDLKVLKIKDIILPLRSTIKDMGRALSHRTQIVKQWLEGKEYSQIALATNHNFESVRNYVQRFKQVAALIQENYDVHTIAFLTKISTPLAEEYIEIYFNHDMLPHRREELDSLIKKKE